MRRRGSELSEHILLTAKDAFLELGFERTSMDVVAERAATSKRTLYAHFENKEKLYLAVIALVRRLFQDRLKSPADYAPDTADALVRFCGRLLEIVLWAPSLGMCRLTVPEVDRFPEGAANHYDAIFGAAHNRLATFLRERMDLGPKAAAEAADDLLGRILFPRWPRALFGIDKARGGDIDENRIGSDDLKQIRTTVAAFLKDRS